jgi:hypothetical protein
LGGIITLENHWQEIRRLFTKSFWSSFHYALASVNEDGSPHLTPIGSLFLTEPTKGFYFELFTTQMPKNFKKNQRVCVLAVRSGFWFWLKSLFFGRFQTPPALRLAGRVGERRSSTEKEKKLWLQRVGWFRGLKGYGLLWKNVPFVREITFDAMIPIHLGTMTEHHWQYTSERHEGRCL